MITFLQRILRLAQPYKLRMSLGIVFGLLAGLADPLILGAVVIVLKLIFSRTDQKSEVFFATLKAQPVVGSIIGQLQTWAASMNHSVWFVVLVVSAIPAVMLFRSTVFYLNTYLMNWVAIRAISDLRVRAFEHLMNLPLSFFSKTSTGELMSRVNDINVLQSIIGNSASVIIKEPVTLITLIVLLCKLEPKLTLLTLAVSPIFIIPIAVFSRKGRKSSAAIQTCLAGLSRMMHETFSGNRIIKAYNLEQIVVKQFRENNRKFLGQYMRVIRSQEMPGPLIEFVGSVGAAALLGFFAFRPEGKLEDFTAFVFMIFLMYRPLKALIRLHSQVEQARAATERIFYLLSIVSPLAEPANPKPLDARGKDIHFENIDFDYGEKPVLRGINLTVKAGQVVALVGSSGSGKTTVTNLLLRFYDPQKGAVRIGETDIRAVSLAGLRSQIAVVTQDTILFNDTIANNIGFGRPGASKAEIEAAAKHAHAAQFIADKPEGFDTMVGEKGIALSGGQRQRLAIARAIVKDAPILVLDEATSSLDTESERAVQEALEELMKGRTTICIAHRLSTIQNADVIVVLDQGRIVESGKHAELLARGGIYHKLYCMQFQNGSEKAA